MNVIKCCTYPWCFLLLLWVFSPETGQATDLPASTTGFTATIELFPRIIEQSKPGVVYLEVSRKASAQQQESRTGTGLFNDPEIERFFSNTPEQTPPQRPRPPSYAHGSGFIISVDGHILTNHHVIDKADSIFVTLADKRRLPARIIGSDSRSDIGLIKINAGRQPLTVLPLGSSQHLRAGQWVLAFGSPFAQIQTVTAGIISATGRNSLGISDYEDYIQTDAAINPGNSGGPLIGIDGRVVGLNTAFITQTGGYMGVGFAIPIDMARTIAEQLLKTGNVTRGWLGVALKDVQADDPARQHLPFDTPAARVAEVQANSPAAAARLLKDDLIVSINDTAIAGAADLRNRIALSPPGSTVNFGVYRNDKRYRFSIKIGALP